MRDEAYWLGLVERFFAAQTSEAEEKELREFLLSLAVLMPVTTKCVP